MSDNGHPSDTRETSPLTDILREMQKTGAFQAAVLTSSDGLAIATIPSGFDSDLTAAIAALLQRVSNEAQNQLGIEEVEEVTIRDRGRNRLVCRYLTVGGEQLILVVVVPPGSYYRRVTSRAIKQIKHLLSAG